MQKKSLFALATAGLLLVSSSHASPYASSVVSYGPGSGALAGFTDTAAVTGQPSTNAVDPFDPATETNQLLSIGAGGWVTVEFDSPIVHYPNGTRGFIVFGDSSFDVTNPEDAFTHWASDGQVVSDSGQTRVSVSRDGVTFYTLNPALAPNVGCLFPTDGSGDFRLPVNPALAPTNFAGLTLADVRLYYNGSAGGASYDIAWAQDAKGNAVWLPDIRYVRVDVLTNSVQIAGFAAVSGTVLTENFSNDPAADGWRTYGDTNLFTWDAINQEMNVTWDSTQPNSYFYHPLGTIMTSNDAFSVSFDMLLNDASTNDDGTNSLQIGIGFLNLGDAENTHFLIGTGENSTNVAEFEFYAGDGENFPPVGVPSEDATLIDTNGDFYFAYDNAAWEFGVFYHVTLNHSAGTSILTGQILANGRLYSSLPTPIFDNAGDFRLNTLSISSYSDAGTPEIFYPCSVTAHGIVKNFMVTGPPPALTSISGTLTNDTWQVQFWSRTHWNYTLEKSTDLQTWLPLAPPAAGTGGLMLLQDASAPLQSQYYKVSANPQQP